MEAVPLTTSWILLLMGVAGAVGVFHLWFGRRGELLHRWVGGWCGVTLIYLVSRLLQVSSMSAERATLGGRLTWTSVLLLIVLSIGLSRALAGRPLTRRGLALLVAGNGAVVAAVWLTEAVVTERAYARMDLLGGTYTAPVPGALMAALIPYILLVFVYCFGLAYRATTLDDPERRAILWGFVLYAGLALHDLLHVTRWIQSIRLFDFAFVAVALAVTYLLVRRYDRLHSRLEDEVAAQTRTLRESEARYRNLFEQNLAGVLWTDLSGRIIDCNESLARVLGYASRAEVLEHNAAEFYVDPSERGRVLAGLEPGGTATGRELHWRRRDGTPVWLRTNIRVSDDGHTEGILVDITDEKRVVQAEAEATELRAITNVAAAAAHEINNPLTILVGQLALLGAEAPGNPRLAKIAAAAERVREIVDRMTRITRIEMFRHTSAKLPPMIDIKKSSEGQA